jgi:putative ABC transport system permease protein
MALLDAGRKGYNLSDGAHPERLQGVRISADFFKVFGAVPLLGREFLPEEEQLGRDHEVILSYALWKSRYHQDASIIGQAIRMDGASYTVVGVMSPQFRFQFWGNPADLWVPVGYTSGDQSRGSHSFAVVARMKPGVTLAQASAQMDAIGLRIMAEHPDTNASVTVAVVPLDSYGVSELKPTLMVLFYVVGFVLLIACVNVANLSLARSTTRHKEIAVRRTLGASRFRLLRQLLTESLLLAIIGGLAGLVVASISLSLIENALPDELKYLPFRPLPSIPMDARVLAFAFLVTCVTGILFGIAPALSAERAGPGEVMKSGSGRGATRKRGRLGNMLVAAEVALALVVVVSAGLLIDSVSRLLAVDPGFRPQHVLQMKVSTPQAEIYYSPPRNARFCEQLRESAGTLPGITGVSAVSILPLEGNAGRGFEIEGRPSTSPDDQLSSAYLIACPGYFAALGIPLLDGRDFTSADTSSAPGVVVINEAMAKKFWPKQSPLGQRIRITRVPTNAPWMTVVGVAHDVRQLGLDNDVAPAFYRPFTQAGWPLMSIVVKTTGQPMAFAESVKNALTQAFPDTPVSDITSLNEVVSDSVSDRRVPMLVLSSFAALALILAAVGIAGVVSYGVAQRTQEIGIRMAFGANPRDVVRMMVGASMKWALAGVAAGIASAFAATRLLAGLLYGVKSGDPFVMTAVAFLLAAVALAASYLPARRATRVDPMVALRYE